MNLADYLDPTDALPKNGGVAKQYSLYNNVDFFKHGKSIPGLSAGDIVIIGIGEDRNSSNIGVSKSPDQIRSYLYSLAAVPSKCKIIDIGNLKETKSPLDTYSATRDVVEHLLSKKTIVVVLGGTQELSVPIYQALKANKKSIEIAFVDSCLDYGINDGDFGSRSYIHSLLAESQKDLFNISILGYQGYLIDSQIEHLVSQNHETLRLGYVRGNFREVEPTLRDSDLVSFDIGAIRYSDCPGSVFPSPNGLYAEEACQLARYAGMSDKNSCFGIFELNPDKDPSGQSAHLAAQLTWHFIEACTLRKGENVAENSNNYKKFIINSNTPGVDLVFYKSLLSDSWWMEVPTNNLSLYPEGRIIVSCSYNDYVIASKQELPERWLRIYNKTAV